MRKYPFDFLLLPEAVWLDNRISYGAKHLLAILLRYSDANFCKEVSLKWLAKKMGVKEREARNRKKELEGAGYIQVIPRKGRVNGFKINVGIWLEPEPEGEGGTNIHPSIEYAGGGAHSMPPNTRESLQENSFINKTVCEDSFEGEGEDFSSKKQINSEKIPLAFWKELERFYIEEFEEEWGFKPAITHSAYRSLAKPIILRLLKSGLKPEEVMDKLKNYLTWYIKEAENVDGSPKAERYPDLKVAFSNASINQYRASKV